MPTRLIKESCRSSANLQRIQDFSERVFWRLLTTADDFGRCYGSGRVVRANCFPLTENISLKKIESALVDLEKHHLIMRYSTFDREYVQFCTFTKHQGNPRAKSSKYPGVSDVSVYKKNMAASAPDTDTDTDLSSLNSLNPLNPDSELKSKDCTKKHAIVMESLDFDAFWRAYPRKEGGRKHVRKAWENAQDKPPIADILTAIERAKQSEQWLKDNGQFIPHPSTWINQGRWADEQVKKPLSTMEAFLSRQPYTRQEVT